jgi:hypothetical protein
VDWSFWDVLWTSFVFFCWIAVLVILFHVIGDVFRSDDLSGWAKAGWIVLVLVLPLIGLLVYLGVRGRGMGDRAVRDQLDRADALRRSMGQPTAGGPADELQKAKQMLDEGVIDDAEFQALKRRILV